jgi:hypothetical protein
MPTLRFVQKKTPTFLTDVVTRTAAHTVSLSRPTSSFVGVTTEVSIQGFTQSVWCLCTRLPQTQTPVWMNKHEHNILTESHQISAWLQLFCIKSIVSSYSGACIFRSDYHYSLIKANQKYGAYFTVFHWRGRAGSWNGFMNTICDVTSILNSKVDSKWPLCLYDERRVMGLTY